MDEYLPLVIQLVSGACGGLTAGKILKSFSMGPLGNAVAGLIGGGAAGWFLGMLGLPPESEGMSQPMPGLTLETVLGSVAAGGVSGGLLMALIGGLRRTLIK